MKASELADLISGKPLLQRKDLARRYGRSPRTIDRWQANGTLPRSRYMHGRFWTPAQIEAAEIRNTKLQRAKRNGDTN